MYTPPAEREDVGLQSVFKSVFPISDFRENSSLEFIEYSIGNWDPCGWGDEARGLVHEIGGQRMALKLKYDINECQERGMTYAVPLKVTIRLVVWNKDPETGAKTIRDIKEQEVYFGDIPLMTDNGTFIINGTERVIVTSSTGRRASSSTPRTRRSSSGRSSRTAARGWSSSTTPRTCSTSASTASASSSRACSCAPSGCAAPTTSCARSTPSTASTSKSGSVRWAVGRFARRPAHGEGSRHPRRRDHDRQGQEGHAEPHRRAEEGGRRGDRDRRDASSKAPTPRPTSSTRRPAR